MNKEEKLTNVETMKHILTVRSLLSSCAVNLIERGNAHDDSKLENPEVEGFTEYTNKLSGVTYGSENYKEFLKALDEPLQHHYKMNRHHPEFHKNKVLDMNLFDMLEMLCDWRAATLRHKDGNIWKSLEVNAKRFDIPDALVKILKNTLDEMDSIIKNENLSLSYPHVEEEQKK